VFGEPALQPVTALIVTEDPEEALREKIAAFGLWRSRIVAVHELNGTTWPEKVITLLALAKAEGHAIVYIENVSRVAGIEDEAGVELARAVEFLADGIRAAGLTGILDHHHRKARGPIEDMSRGSTSIAGATDVNLDVVRVGGPTSCRRKLTSTGRLRATIWQKVIELSEDGTSYEGVLDNADDDTEVLFDRWKLGETPDGVTARTFAASLGLDDPAGDYARRKAKARLDRLVEGGFALVDRSCKEHLYALVAADADTDTD
jgi:hypothetical protein